MESLTIKRENVIFKTELWTGSEYVELNDLIWSTVLHNAYGLCFTADLSKVEKFEFVPYEDDTRPFFFFVQFLGDVG